MNGKTSLLRQCRDSSEIFVESRVSFKTFNFCIRLRIFLKKNLMHRSAPSHPSKLMFKLSTSEVF